MSSTITKNVKVNKKRGEMELKPLSEEKKAEVRNLHKQGYKHRQIAAIAGISATSVSHILKPRSPEQNKTCNIPQSLWDEWDHITSEIRKKAYTGARLRRQNI